ncbi:hypothetical protein CPB84DRAFT_230782 [Gymnopilus junonius]|uniref:Uncharacterized protein n=1 Tax=Gymnopilus junonius TaxID=109634 RepID=A0A9P5NFJ1_GYMJU|nr:hypothetical protein CPB84DRAFT_230782 [Gymnopilus junonius]
MNISCAIEASTTEPDSLFDDDSSDVSMDKEEDEGSDEVLRRPKMATPRNTTLITRTVYQFYTLALIVPMTRIHFSGVGVSTKQRKTFQSTLSHLFWRIPSHGKSRLTCLRKSLISHRVLYQKSSRNLKSSYDLCESTSVSHTPGLLSTNHPKRLTE